MQVYSDVFEQIISIDNLFAAWEEFVFDKRGKIDVQEFSFHLEENIFRLHRDLAHRKYKHGAYSGFYICDPKVRHIHKATVRDRVLHHAIFRILNPIFEPTFIAHSFSCRIGKGTHNGVEALERMLRKESKNYRHQAYALKCDVRKFFDSIDQDILMQIMQKRIKDEKTLWLLKEIVTSYNASPRERERERERVKMLFPACRLAT